MKFLKFKKKALDVCTQNLLWRDDEVPFSGLIYLTLLLQLHKRVINDVVSRLLHVWKANGEEFFDRFKCRWLSTWCKIQNDITNGLG